MLNTQKKPRSIENMQGLRDEALLRIVCERLGTLPHELPRSATSYMMRFAHATDDNPDEVVRRLHRRRQFELSLPLVTATPATVLCLRSGAFTIWRTGDAFSRPILFVRPSLIPDAVRGNWQTTVDGVSELEVLALMLLEYLSYFAAKHTTSAAAASSSSALAKNGNALVGVSAGGGGNSTSSSSNASPTTTSPTTAGGAGMDCAVLVDATEADSAWLHNASSTFFSTLTTITAKYYPGLISACWVVMPPTNSKLLMQQRQQQQQQHGASQQAAAAKVPAGFEHVLRYLQVKDLPSIVDVSVLPRRLGGGGAMGGWRASPSSSAAAASPTALVAGDELPAVAPSVFSSNVLRCWYSLTSLLLQEAGGGLGEERDIGADTNNNNARGGAGAGTAASAANGATLGASAAAGSVGSASSGGGGGQQASPQQQQHRQSLARRPIWVPISMRLVQVEGGAAAASFGAGNVFPATGKRGGAGGVGATGAGGGVGAGGGGGGGGSNRSDSVMDEDDDDSRCSVITSAQSIQQHVHNLKNNSGLLNREDSETSNLKPNVRPRASSSGNNNHPDDDDDDDLMEDAVSEPGQTTNNLNSSTSLRININFNTSGTYNDEALSQSQQLLQKSHSGGKKNGRQQPLHPQKRMITAGKHQQGGINKDAIVLSRQLELEKRCRAQLETQVQRLTLGVTFEGDRAAAALFGTLRACHEEANVLVAEVVTKSLQQHTTTNRPPPSLTELFDNFERELSSVIGADTEGSAPLPSYLLKSTEVVHRQPPESSPCLIA